MNKLELLYEGKAKKVFKTDDPDVLIVDYKDDATAFNGEKKGTIVGKGVINNRMTNHVFKLLEKEGVPTHFVEELSERETAVKKVEIVPLEVIIRNVAAGSFSKRLGVPEGTPFKEPTIEFSYKNDELGDPLINSYFAVALGLATWEELDTIKKYAFKVNDVLKKYFLGADIKLIDFKIEFGRYMDRSSLRTKQARIPAVCGMFTRMRSWIRTVSAEISEMWRKRITRCLSGLVCRRYLRQQIEAF